jgi:transposase
MFYELLNELCKLIPEMPKGNGRPPIPLRDLFFMSALKLYCNFSLRKIHCDLKEAEGCGYIKKAGHFNRISDFFNSNYTYDLLTKFLTISAMPLKQLEDDFSMDASGFGSYEKDRWVRVRFNESKRVEWRKYLKGHVLIGTKTNIICSAEITNGNFSDVKQAPRLLEQANNNFDMKRISADKGYSSQKVFQLIDSIGATPFIVFKNNSNPSENSPKIWQKMYRYFEKNKDNFMKFYHRRSNVETTFSMIKLRLGEFLKCKNYEAQRNELLMKFVVHNITCLVSEIFENSVHIDFKECIKQYVEPKPIEIAQEPEKPIGDIIIPDREF